jgi:hypothetical protein
VVTSPYRAVLGAAFDELHPRLRAYFDTIPAGAVGRGRGVFDTVGTPRRWLWPLLAGFARAQVMFPVWERDVPFTVENRRMQAPGAGPAVAAVRTFALRGRPSTMVDEIGLSDGALVDRLGAPVRAEARFAASVRDGALRLRSTAVWIVLGGRRVRVPGPLAPVVALTERWDEAAERQHVSIAVRMPVIGRIYQYSGRFEYRIVEEHVEQEHAEEEGERSS